MKVPFITTYRLLVALFLWGVAGVKSEAQNTVYTPLFTSASFVRSLDVNLPASATPASADASAGSANYTVPIAVPPGTGGVTPQISVTYNSMGGNSILGYGWNIDGLSIITRSQKTIYHEGSVAPVDLSSSDHFALDGMRIRLKSGTYGADAATYGPEVEDFSTITSYGNFGGGPQWFRVFTKDGITMEYGNTSDSRFLTEDGTKVLFWRLNKVLYNDGNYIEIKYLNTDRESRVDEINYTGNANAGLLPYNKLKFTYTIRTDVTTAYEAQNSVASKYLLDKITVTAEGATFKTYTFKYGFNNVNSFLKEIVEAGSDGTALNSTIFKYGDEPTALQTSTSSSLQNQQVDVFSGDFNADGFSDILACTRNVVNNTVYHTNMTVYKGSLSGAFTSAATKGLPTNFMVVKKKDIPNSYNFFTSDYTGDGADDVITAKVNSTGTSLDQVVMYKSINDAANFADGVNIALPNNYNKIHSSGHYIFPGDFNGDGIGDVMVIVGHNSSSIYYPFMFLGSNTPGNFVWTGSNGPMNFPIDTWQTMDKIHIVDFDGDGKSDIMLIKDETCEIFTMDNGFIARRIYLSGFPTKWHLLYFGDFNGDHKTDILCRTSTTNNNAPWYKDISTGKAFVETPFTFSHKPDINEHYYGDRLIISDFNGEGKMDISHAWNYFVNGVATTAKIDMYYSRGNDFYYEQSTYSKTFNTNPESSYDFNGDGRSDLLNRYDYMQPFEILYFKKAGKELLLEKAKNGFNHQVEWSYKRMPEAGSFYTRGALTEQPFNNVQLPLCLVYQFKTDNGIGGTTTIQYNYEEAKLHKAGKGLLGLKKLTAWNQATGMKSVQENEFNTTYYAMVPYKNSTYLASTNTLLSEATLTNQFTALGTYSEKRFWHSVSSSYVNQAFEGRFVSTTNTYDSYGNVTSNLINNNNVETTLTNTGYAQYGTPVPSKPYSINITNTRAGQPGYSKPTTYYAYNSLGQITSITSFSAQSQQVVTAYTYNNLGNKLTESVIPTGMTTRTTTFTYDSKGRFPLTTTNPLNQVTTTAYDNKWGKPSSVTEINGLTTTMQYDALGRLVSTAMPEGYSVTDSYGWDINATNGTVHYHLTTHPGKPDTKIWYDILSREKMMQTEGFQNQWITTKQTYDARGNIATSTTPSKSGESILTTTNTYDTYNRLSTTANSIGTTTYSYAFSGGNLTTTVTNPASQSSSKISDASGKTISTTDNGATLTHIFDSQGNQIQTKQGATVLVSYEYDIYGRQSKLIDINSGTIQYVYNSLGELTSQTNANSQVRTMQYDLLGRMTQRNGPEGLTTFEYYPTGTAAANQIKKVTGFSGNLEEFTYDGYGRVLTSKETIDGVAYTTTYGYNSYGDITSLAYPSGFTANTVYDANGFVNTIKNTNNTVTLFTNTGMNGFNQYTSYTLGNGKTSQNTYYFGTATRFYTPNLQDLNLSWNYQNGNLNSRYDAAKGKLETFTYDNLNRLLTSSTSGQPTITMTYAGNGNINSKTDVGNYLYSPTKINAVTNVTNTPGNIPVAQQDISFTAFMQPGTISENNYQLTYTYGSDFERIKSVLKQNGLTINTRWYFGGYEIDNTVSSTKHLHYINAGQNLIAIVVRENNVDSYYYTYTDHLGSILTVTDNTGAIIADQNFDAWGRRRNTATWSYTGIQSVPSWLYRGYTAHEHLPQFGLINMNGRLYDPLLGRMLSPDNYIQMPGFSQSYNRFTYAVNNPLRFTDPSGKLVWFVPVIIGAVVGAYIGASVQSGTAAFWNWRPDAWKGAIVGAFIGAAVGYMVAPALSVTGITTAAGTVSQAWGITTSAINGANIAMMSSAITGGDSADELWKSGVVGAASAAWAATGGVGLAKAFGSKNGTIKFISRLAYQGVGTAGRSIGNNWARDEKLFSRVTLGVGPINLTLGKGQRLIQWQNNIGNILMNSFGLVNTAFGGKIEFNAEHLTMVYKGGIADKIFDPNVVSTGFSPYAVSGNSGVDDVMDHELHHVWQSRALGDNFMADYSMQGLLSLILNGFSYFSKGDSSYPSFIYPGTNYYESIPDFYNWW